MAVERNYGWTPEQLAQVNARREARGQSPFVDSRIKSDSEYGQAYAQAGQDYASRQAGAMQRNQMKLQGEEDKEKSFAEQAAAMRSGATERDKKRQDLMKLNVDFLKMKQGGGNMNWNQFKQLQSSPKVTTPPASQSRSMSWLYS